MWWLTTLVIRLLRKYSTSGYKSRGPGFEFAISQPATVHIRGTPFPSQSTVDFSLETPITGTRCVKNIPKPKLFSYLKLVGACGKCEILLDHFTSTV